MKFMCFSFFVFSVIAEGAMNLSLAVDSSTREIALNGQLNDTSDGLAFFSFNLTLTGPEEVNLGEVLALNRPSSMTSFENPLGLSNPLGYGGTPDGSTLFQIGGGQNTLPNLGTPVEPTGTVVEGIATGAEPQLLASGKLNTCGLAEGTYTLTITDPYALVLDANQAGPTYTVSPVQVTSEQNFQISFQILEKSCVTTVTSMANHGTTEGDLGIQIYPPLDVFGQPFNCESRDALPYHWLDIQLDAPLVNVNDLAVTATDALGVSVSAAVTTNPSSDVITAQFNPPLDDARIYTINVTGERVNEFSCEYVVLAGNVVNIEGMNVVTSTDRTILGTKLGQTASVAGAMYDIERSGTSLGVIDTDDRDTLNEKLGNVAQHIVSAVSVATHGSSEGDLGIQVFPIPDGSTIGNCEPRILTEHKLELTFDGDVTSMVGLIVEAEDSLGTVTTATVTSSGNTATAEFDPALTDQKIYTIYCSGCAKGSFPFVVLQGNVYNQTTSQNAVNTEDDSDFDLKAGQAPSSAGAQYDLNLDGAIDALDDTELNNRQSNTAS